MSNEGSGAHWIITALLVAGAAGGGYFIGNLESAESTDRLQALEVDRAAEAQEATARLEQATSATKVAQAQVGELAARNRELATENDGLQQRLLAAQAPPAVEPEPADVAPPPEPAPQEALAVAFGKWGELDQLTAADWPGMAEAVENMSSMIESLYAQILAGEEPSQEDQIAIARENQRLVGFALEIIGQLPTHAPANGEYAHPITLANLSAAVLDRAGEPLSEAQRAAIARLGDDYQQAWDSSQSAYGEDAPAVTKLADELAFKRDFIQGARGELTEAQLAQLTPASILDRNRLDVLSPVVMTIGSGRVIQAATPEELRAQYATRVGQGYGLSAEELEGLDYIFDTWAGDVGSILTPTSAEGAGFYDLDQAVASAQAHAQVVASLLSSPNLDQESRDRLLEESGFVIPRLVE